MFWSPLFQLVSAEDNCSLYNVYVLVLNVVYLLEALTKVIVSIKKFSAYNLIHMVEVYPFGIFYRLSKHGLAFQLWLYIFTSVCLQAGLIRQQ